MRYGQPSVRDTLQSLLADGCDELFVMPLYPQYAMSSYETAVAQVRRVVDKIRPDLKVDFLPPFYRDPEYIDASF